MRKKWWLKFISQKDSGVLKWGDDKIIFFIIEINERIAKINFISSPFLLSQTKKKQSTESQKIPKIFIYSQKKFFIFVRPCLPSKWFSKKKLSSCLFDSFFLMIYWWQEHILNNLKGWDFKSKQSDYWVIETRHLRKQINSSRIIEKKMLFLLTLTIFLNLTEASEAFF